MGQRVSKRKKAKGTVTPQDRAVLDLKNSRDRLKRYQKKLDEECVKLQAQAAAMLKEGRKDRALLLLKVKKLKQEQANKADAQLLSVLQLMDTIDWETQQLRVFNALKEGNQALARLHEEMPLEKVEELMQDTAENIAMEEEISRAIGGSWTEANEEDLLEELVGLEAEANEEQAAALAAQMPLPETKPRPSKEATAAAAAAAAAAASTRPAELEEMLPVAPTGKVVRPSTATVGREEAVEEPKRPTAVPA